MLSLTASAASGWSSKRWASSGLIPYLSERGKATGNMSRRKRRAQLRRLEKAPRGWGVSWWVALLVLAVALLVGLARVLR